mmetsp:Transcript_16902/g.25475  ORF Transcript_16902/g.25475 Transcript_16902/m.25475 type:complete len:708 (+) Transcript_16902:82-2205(+)
MSSESPHSDHIRSIFDETDPRIRSDILRIIVEHLNREKLYNAATVLEDEISSRLVGLNAKRLKVLKFHKTILIGDWDECLKLLSSLVPKPSLRCFIYHILRQQYLELIDIGDHERAYSFLMKHLKPLEDIAIAQGQGGNEFKELCYLLTCKSVGESDHHTFRRWKHYYHQRELVADELVDALYRHLQAEGGVFDICPPPMVTASAHSLATLVQRESSHGRKGGESGNGRAAHSHSSRLVRLLKQSYAFQAKQTATPDCRELHAESSNCSQEAVNGKKDFDPVPLVRRVMEDYVPVAHPTSLQCVISTKQHVQAHSREPAQRLSAVQDARVSCSTFCRGSSDNQCRVIGGIDGGLLAQWRIDLSRCNGDVSPVIEPVYSMILPGMFSEDSSKDGKRTSNRKRRFQGNKKIRDICVDESSSVLATASSDGCVNILARASEGEGWYQHSGRLTVHQGDCQAVHLYPEGNYLVSGGFDRNISVIDVETLSITKTFRGHSGAVTQVGCNRSGNLVYSSSRDGTVKFWDMLSGSCVRTFSPNSRTSSTQSAGRSITEVTSAVMSFDGLHMLTSSRFSPCRLLDMRTGQVVAKYISPNGCGSMSPFYRPTFCSSDTGVVAGAANGSVSLWPTHSGRNPTTLELSHYADGNHNSFMEHISKLEVTRCGYDRFTGVVSALTSDGVALWSTNRHQSPHVVDDPKSCEFQPLGSSVTT